MSEEPDYIDRDSFVACECCDSAGEFSVATHFCADGTPVCEGCYYMLIKPMPAEAPRPERDEGELWADVTADDFKGWRANAGETWRAAVKIREALKTFNEIGRARLAQAERDLATERTAREEAVRERDAAYKRQDEAVAAQGHWRSRAEEAERLAEERLEALRKLIAAVQRILKGTSREDIIARRSRVPAGVSPVVPSNAQVDDLWKTLDRAAALAAADAQGGRGGS